MKIVFLGEDSFSGVVLQSLINAGHELLAVFCPIYENNIFARLKLMCDRYNIPFYRVKDINSQDVELLIEGLRPDIISVCHFQKLLKKNIIQIPKKGCVNLHPSLLPNYRGMSPQHWPIINGDQETGITVHFIDEGVDTGDIILQRPIQIESDMYVSELQNKMMEIYKSIVVDSLELVADGSVEFKSQIEYSGSYYGKLKQNQCIININGDVKDAYNLIRGVSMPYFGASFENFTIWKVKFAEKYIEEEINVKFPQIGIYLNSDFGDFLKFSDGVLIIEKYKIN